MRYILAALICSSSLGAAQMSPWLGNLYEFEGAVSQERRHSSHLTTEDGTVSKSLHSNVTTLSLGFTPKEDIGVGLELAMAESQSVGYSFDALRGQVRYNLLNDLTDDPISLTAGVSGSVSPMRHVHDLSTQNHGHIEGQFDLAAGFEFGYADKSFWRTWAGGYTGVADKGAPWLGGSLHLERHISDTHTVGAFLLAEKGFSKHKLHHAPDFRSWAQTGYSYDEVGLEYTYTFFGVASCQAKISKCLHASNCPSGVWSFLLAVNIPFSPW
jgi:hypothetical protein